MGTPITPSIGPVAVLKLKGGSLGSAAVVPGINWKIDIDPKLKDVSNFKSGRFRAPTLGDCTFSTTLVYDTSTNPFLDANGGLKAGAVITADCYVDATNFFEVPLMISKVGAEVSALEDVTMCAIEAQLHDGTVAYPAA
jgi:hypothetical protein